jgi:hypothetical protein
MYVLKTINSKIFNHTGKKRINGRKKASPFDPNSARRGLSL